MRKTTLIALSVATLITANTAYANTDFGSISSTIVTLLGSVSEILDVIAWVCGAGFAISAIVKYKEHRRKPQSVPLGGPLTEMIIAIILISFPFIMDSTAYKPKINDGANDQASRQGQSSSLERDFSIGLINDSYHYVITPKASSHNVV